mgnify:CR=1 FL=1
MVKFTYDRFVTFLRDIRDGRYSKNEAVNVMYDFMQDPDFLRSNFLPKDSDMELVQKYSKEMYKLFGSLDCLKVLKKCLKENLPDFNRSHAAFVFTIAFRVTKNCKSREEKLAKVKPNYSDDDIDRTERAIQEHSRQASKLIELCFMIVDDQAETISERSGLNSEFVHNAICYVPEPRYIRRNTVGTQYMDILLSGLLKYIYRERIPTEYIAKWDEFFVPIVGRDNQYEVAVKIVSDGRKYTKKYVDEYGALDSYVDEAMATMTNYALNVLERAPLEMKDHMLDLYAKKIGRMVSNGDNAQDIVSNIMNLDSNKYPTLWNALSKYKNKFMELMGTSMNVPIEASDPTPAPSADAVTFPD